MTRRILNTREENGDRAVHDLGGLEAGRIDRTEHPLTFYEKRVDALLMLLAGPKRQIFRVDALRRAIEEYSRLEYDGQAYYDRWITAMRNLLVEQEVLSAEEIDEKVAEIRADLETKGVPLSAPEPSP